MTLGPWLVTRGLIIGNLFVIMLTSLLSANISLAAAPAPAIEVSPAVVQASENPQVSTSCAVSPKFPDEVRQWCRLITQYGEQHGLAPDLVAAVIWQESGGDPQAYSRSGAVGLMQVMPRDGVAASFQCVNGPCFSERPSIDELRDAEFNVQYGTRMLGKLVERHGSLREALKAYGPMDRGYSYADRVLGLYHQYGQ